MFKKKKYGRKSNRTYYQCHVHRTGNCGYNLGYHALCQRLQKEYGLIIKRDTVLKILQIVDPVGIEVELSTFEYILNVRTFKKPLITGRNIFLPSLIIDIWLAWFIVTLLLQTIQFK